jgi:hypothetical protein
MAGGANPQQTQTPMAQPMQPMQGGQPNVFDQSSGAYNAALGGTQQAMAGPNIGAFMNPYPNMVTGQALGDLERQRQMATNTMDAQAGQAGAFGGSRHGIAQGATNEGFARQGANMFAGLQNQGFNTALGAAQNQQGIQMQGAGQLGNLSNLGFGFGNQISDRQQAQGGLQQGTQQMLIDAARNQFDGFTGAPTNALQTRIAATGAANMGQNTQTEKKNAGLFDYLALGASLSDIRLKTNIKLLGSDSGFNVYSWDWNADGKRIADPAQQTVGVMAQEVQETHPHLVQYGADGFLRVNYGGLAAVLG